MNKCKNTLWSDNRNETKRKKNKYRTETVRFTEAIIARTTTAAAATIVNGCFSICYHSQFEYLHNKNEKKEVSFQETNAIRSKK